MIFYESKHVNTERYYSIEEHHDLNFGLHYHKNFEVIYCHSGNLTIKIDNLEHILHTHEICIILPNQTHSITTSISSSCFIGVFSTHYIPGLYSTFKDIYTTTPILHMDNIEDLISEIARYKDNQFKLSAKLCTIIAHLYDNNEFFDRDQKYRSFVIKTLNYFESEFNKSPSLVDLSKILGYNSHYVSNLFSKCFNKNFAQTLNDYRIEYALTLLRHDDFTITNIASMCGYDSTRNFNRNFLSITGITPSEARKNTPIIKCTHK